MRRVTTLLALSAGLLLVLSGTAFADAEVEIGDDGLNPETVNVDVREAIIWTNATDQEHSLVGKDPSWESGPIAPGATFSIEITEKGRYSYGSEDGSLSGEIVVGNPKDPFDEPTEGATEAATEDSGSDNEGGRKDDKEPLAESGTNATVPAGLSVLLIGFGGGLLALTEPRRRRA
jgi:plastocyanin